jgi:hypothetical protein
MDFNMPATVVLIQRKARGRFDLAFKLSIEAEEAR